MRKSKDTIQSNAYGKFCEDVEEINLEKLIEKCEIFLQTNVLLTDKQIDQIYIETIGQTQDVWYKQRKLRLTASNFGKICSRRDNTEPSNLIKSMLYNTSLSTKEIEYGKCYGPGLIEIKCITIKEFRNCSISLILICEKK